MEKHIKQILQEVNTIIIPGIGALTVTNHKTGEIMFMPYLKYDDGKLASFIAENEAINLDEAKAMISDDVSNILNAIEAGKSFNLNGIGSFKKDTSGGIEFKSGVYDEESSTNNGSGEIQAKEEAIIEIVEKIVVQQIEEIPVIQEEIKLDPNEDIIPEEAPVVNESKKKGFFGMFNKDTVSSIESVDLEEEESDIAFEIELPQEEVVEKEAIQVVEKEEEISFPIEEKLEVDELSAPEIIIDAKESIYTQEDSTVEIGSSESISKNTISDEEFLADDEVITPVKKKKGVKFWLFTILILLIAGGGTFVGLNFDKYKKYLPLGSKTETIDISEEDKIIETLESDDTEPLKDKASKTEEMIDTPEEVKVLEEIIPEPKVEPIAVETSTDEQLKIEPVRKNKPKAKSYSKVKMEDVQVQSISDGSFYIILGTFAEKVSAVGQVEMLLTKGKKGASVIERDNKFSVSYGTYSSIEEAKAKLDEAKAAYNHAWILHK